MARFMASHFNRKRFGQHFLHDPVTIEQLLIAIAPQPQQHLVEIGPGQGALTFPLLQRVNTLNVIEIDRDLAQKLKRHSPILQIHQGDVLRFDFRQLKTEAQLLRVVGNLPYNISTPLLFYLLKYIDCIQDMIFMLQKEVVDRMVATPATAHYGQLSVILQYHYQITQLFDVAPQAFSPPPQVYSSVVHLMPHTTPPVPVACLTDFNRVVKQAFSQRRKILRNTLKGLLDVQAIQAVDIDPQTRPETLTLGQFAQLANHLTQQAG